MGKYVMSDIHGCYDKFIEMLKLINFNDNDELYILGDIFDRGPEPIKILDHIIGNKNIYLIKGNHEQMFIDAIDHKDYMHWYCSGGQVTHEKIMELGQEKEQQIYDYIKSLPIIKIVDNFILVHANLYTPRNYELLNEDELIKIQNNDHTLWDREHIGEEKRYKDYTIICGHTPVQTISEELRKESKIYYSNNYCYIDCGCVFDKVIDSSKLACLRLNDMKEFYV